MIKNLMVIMFIVFSMWSFAEESEVDAWSDKSFVIIASKKNYDEAEKIAIEASSKLKTKMDLRGLSPNDKTGLTFSKVECENQWDRYPCYWARGRWDDGEYISIEYSNQYKGFQKGYYIVVFANSSKSSSWIKKSLKKVNEIYKDAYIKNTKVWLGCIN